MVSVIMAVYNGERFLAEAIESVLAQTCGEFEFVIVDDGSKDRSAAILAEYAARDSRIVLVSQENRGLPASLNRAIGVSRYEWLARMDADDRMLPNRIERQIDFVRANPDVTVACSFSYLINSLGQRVGKSENTVDIEAGLARKSPTLFLEIVHPSVLLKKRDIVLLGGYPESFNYAEDRELWGRVATSGKLIKCQPEILMEYRLHGGAMTMQKALQICVKFEFIDSNIVRRLKDEQDLTEDQFKEWRRERPALVRLNEWRRWTALLYYKEATRHYSEKRPFHFGLAFGVAAALRPISTLHRALLKLMW
jgi:glycosyltransferase involved in cell wall biosynthesis